MEFLRDVGLEFQPPGVDSLEHSWVLFFPLSQQAPRRGSDHDFAAVSPAVAAKEED